MVLRWAPPRPAALLSLTLYSPRLDLLHQIIVDIVQSSHCFKGSSPEWSLNHRKMCVRQAEIDKECSVSKYGCRDFQPVFALSHTYKEDHESPPPTPGLSFSPVSRSSQVPQLHSQKKADEKLAPQQSFPCFLSPQPCWLSCLGGSLCFRCLPMRTWLSAAER